MSKYKILLLTKSSEWGHLAEEIINKYDGDIECHKGQFGQKMPALKSDKYDLIISFSSPWIVPKHLLENVGKAALNFHPGPPNYPGIGCTNFALYNQEKEFGATCHHMAPKVDSGDIVNVARFPLYGNETVLSITGRTYIHMFAMYEKILADFFKNEIIPTSNEKWTRKAYTRKELNDLCIITKDMPDDEVKRRVNAVAFPGKPGAYVEIAGKKFIYKSYYN